MDLTTLQREAFLCAESKGLHDDLDHGPITDSRNLALAGLINVYASLSDLTQHIKRHGVEDLSTINMIMSNAETLLELWYRDLISPNRGAHHDPSTATRVRLALLHTEIDETSNAIDEFGHESKEGMAELADILIRAADLAECLMRNKPGSEGALDRAVVTKLAYNWTRAHRFGTPMQQETTP